MDGDQSGKSMDTGSASAAHAQGLTEGIHEKANMKDAVGEKTTGTGTSVFDAKGAIGSKFNADGAIGGTAQAVGGPFDKEGVIGKHFNKDGAVGGTVQENIANKK